MASETDAKTRLGLSQCLVKANQIHATLGAIDPDSDDPDVVAAIRRARGLAAASVVAIQHLETVCYDLWQTRAPRQLSLDELLQSTRRLVVSVRDEEEEAVRQAAEIDDEEDEEDEPDAGEASVGNVRSFFGAEPPAAATEDELAALRMLLVAAGHDWPTALLARWTAEERQSARAWADAADRDELPAPAHVLADRLETLDVEEDDDDLATILHWLGFPEGWLGDDWSLDERNAVAAWAVAAHRHDRGEQDVEVPPLPEVLMPDASTIEPIRRAVASGGGEVKRDEVLSVLDERDPAAHLLLDALIAVGDVEVTGDGHLVLPEVAIDAPDEELLAGARAIGQRQPWPADEAPAEAAT